MPTLDGATVERMLRYAWPGNVRELKNAVERTLLLSGGTNLIWSTETNLDAAGDLPRTQLLSMAMKHGWSYRSCSCATPSTSTKRSGATRPRPAVFSESITVRSAINCKRPKATRPSRPIPFPTALPFRVDHTLIAEVHGTFRVFLQGCSGGEAYPGKRRVRDFPLASRFLRI